MRFRWLAVLVLAVLGAGSPAAFAQMKLLDLIADSGGPGANQPAEMPASDRFLASPDVNEASAGSLKLAIRSLRGEMYWWFWTSATVAGGAGDDIRSVEYRFKNGAKEVRSAVSDKASNFALAIQLSSNPTIEAHATVVRRGKQEVVVLQAQVPAPGLKAAAASGDYVVPPHHFQPAPESQPPPVARQPAAPPLGGGSTSSTGALPAGVRFSVSATPTLLTGGVETEDDTFKLQLEGDAAGLGQISRVEYALDSTQAGDRNRNFFIDGSVSRSRWPIAVKITWKNGKVTRANLSRP